MIIRITVIIADTITFGLTIFEIEYSVNMPQKMNDHTLMIKGEAPFLELGRLE